MPHAHFAPVISGWEDVAKDVIDALQSVYLGNAQPQAGIEKRGGAGGSGSWGMAGWGNGGRATGERTRALCRAVPDWPHCGGWRGGICRCC